MYCIYIHTYTRVNVHIHLHIYVYIYTLYICICLIQEVRDVKTQPLFDCIGKGVCRSRNPQTIVSTQISHMIYACALTA